jgi:HEPN domain-containing protein
MVPGRLPPDDPREWLNRARSSLTIAREGAAFPEIYLEDLCFDAQQAAEKAIKAVLLHLGAGNRRPTAAPRSLKIAVHLDLDASP